MTDLEADISQEDNAMKWCPKCKTRKVTDDFDLRTTARRQKEYRGPWCRECTLHYHREYSKLRRKRQRDDVDAEHAPLSDLTHVDAENAPSDLTQANATQTDALYVMRNTRIPGMVKIGKSHTPEDRARDMARSHPFEMVICSTYEKWGFLEKLIHYKLRHRNVIGGSGREWYHVTPEQADRLISNVIGEHEILASLSEYEE